MQFVKNFHDINKDDVTFAGGKGASLGEMMQAHIPVPPGFVILSTTFEKFMKDANLSEKIDAILHDIDYQNINTVENASDKIHSLVSDATLPDNIADEIQKSFNKLNAKSVAVRSSAISEDSTDASWAGQLNTYLNTTERNLFNNIKKCWASLYTPRAIHYRFENNLDNQKVSVAVVIQKMVESQRSGIAFSVHPVSEDRTKILIEAGFGLGEAIVSGQITPDSYVVDKTNWQVLGKTTNKQERLMTYSDKGGVEWQVVLGVNQGKQKLSDDEIIKLAKLVTKIEDHYGFPCDIEWATENNTFFITQSRPITTLGMTKNKPSIFEYIKSQQWFFGVRAEESLLLYSARRDEFNRYIEKEYGTGFAETLLVPLKKDHPVRVFNLSQSKTFHGLSNQKILDNPRILVDYVDKDGLLYQTIEKDCQRLVNSVEKGDYDASVKLFTKILNQYKIASAEFIITFSLGLKLDENKDNLKNIDDVIEKHDKWRNSVIFKEEAMSKKLIYFLKSVTKKRKLKLDPAFLMKFITLSEIEAWLDNKLSDAKLAQIIDSRNTNGYIYLGLRGNNQEIVDDSLGIAQIREYFLKLDQESNNLENNEVINGQVAFGLGEVLQGEVIVIEDRFELKDKNHLIDGKILVAIQTTPHYIPYLKNAKAIIADEGGLTCHAAIVAREFKIPCIVGIKVATQILKDGDIIEVDMRNGSIVIKG